MRCEAETSVTQETNLIGRISRASDRYGNMLLLFMERYGLQNLMQAKEEQLTEFIRKENIA